MLHTDTDGIPHSIRTQLKRNGAPRYCVLWYYRETPVGDTLPELLRSALQTEFTQNNFRNFGDEQEVLEKVYRQAMNTFSVTKDLAVPGFEFVVVDRKSINDSKTIIHFTEKLPGFKKWVTINE